MQGKMRKLGAATFFVASAVLALATSAGGSVERLRVSIADATVLASVQEGCVTWSTQLSAYGTTTRTRSTTVPDSAVAVWVSAYDTCNQTPVGSWQGSIQPAGDKLSLASDLSAADVRAQVPVTDYVGGGSSIVDVDLRIENTGVALDQTAASHYHDSSILVNWSGRLAVYEASATGSVRLDGRELVAGQASRNATLTSESFGQTLVMRQQMLARAFAGSTGGTPSGSSFDGLAARWSDGSDRRFVETSVAAQDMTSWDGTRQRYASMIRLEYDSCTGGDVSGFYATGELAPGALTTHAAANGALAATLSGNRLDSGAPVTVDVDLGWTGTGTRGTWQLTIHNTPPGGPSTFHHNEVWRPATAAGTIAVDGRPLDPGTFADAGFHSETNIVTGS